MFCKNCGKELPDGASFCSDCGQKTEYATEDPDFKQLKTAVYLDPNIKRPQHWPAAKASLALGIISIIVMIFLIIAFFEWFMGYPLIMGILAIFFSCVYKIRNRGIPKGSANAGLVLGIIDVVVTGIILSQQQWIQWIPG